MVFMRVLLDSSFIVSCVRNRIDFLSQLEGQGFRVLVPREVLQELKDLKNKNTTSHDDRIAIKVALDMLSKKRISKIKIGGKNVDDGLIMKGNEGYHVATLDAAIKRQVPDKIVVFRSKGKVGAG
jgi:rRNA-processing protein FCF1